MKTILLIILLLNACIKHFEVMTEYKEDFKIDKINIYYMAPLSADKLIIIGNSHNDLEINSGQRLFIVNKNSKEILFESKPVESAYEGNLYQVIIKNHKLILWEIKNEFFSDLKLFKLSNSKFIYIGDFEVALDIRDKYIEDFSYPVKEIEIEESDNFIHFKFMKDLTLYPFQENPIKIEPNSLIYELDLINDNLKIKQ